MIIRSELSDTPLGLRRRSKAKGESKARRSLRPGAELGEPRCECTSSSSSSDCFSQPFCTLTMAYERRVLSWAESWTCVSTLQTVTQNAITHLSNPCSRMCIHAFIPLVCCHIPIKTMRSEPTTLHGAICCSLVPLGKWRVDAHGASCSVTSSWRVPGMCIHPRGNCLRVGCARLTWRWWH